MNTADILEVIREQIGQAVDEVNCNTPTYPDTFLLQYVNTANLTLSVLGVQTNVVVSVASGTITPDTTIPIGMLLATKASVAIVKGDLISRVRNGELGMSFSSGASSISTTIAANILKTFGDGLAYWFNTLLTAYLSGDPNTILGRDL